WTTCCAEARAGAASPPPTTAPDGLRRLRIDAGHAGHGRAPGAPPRAARECRGHAEPRGAVRLPAGGDPGERAQAAPGAVPARAGRPALDRRWPGLGRRAPA